MISAACSGRVKKSERRKMARPVFFLQNRRVVVRGLLLKFTFLGGSTGMVSALLHNNRAIAANAKRYLDALQCGRDGEVGC